MRVNPGTVGKIPVAAACVDIRARNVAQMPIKIYTNTSGGGKKVADNHPVYDILYGQPNGFQTAFEWKQMMNRHLDEWGNAYSEIKSGPRGAVDTLTPLHPGRVQVQQIGSGRIRYQYQDPFLNQPRMLMQDEVFHLRVNSDDGVNGRAVSSISGDIFALALAANDYASRYFANNATPGGIITGTNFRTKEEEKDFIANWQAGSTGANRGKARILPAGVEYKQISSDPDKTQLVELQKFIRIQIASLYGVPPHLIGETEKTATYASVEQFNIMFAVQCILPLLVLWEQAIQRDLILNPKYYAKFSMAALLRGDTPSRFAAYHLALGDGWISQDEVRALEDMNPIPDEIGSKYWRPVNWTTLDNTEPPTQATAGGGDDDPGDPSSDPTSGDGLQGKSLALPNASDVRANLTILHAIVNHMRGGVAA